MSTFYVATMGFGMSAYLLVKAAETASPINAEGLCATT